MNPEAITLRHLDHALQVAGLELDHDGAPRIPVVFVDLDSGVPDHQTVATLHRLRSHVIAIGLCRDIPGPHMGEVVEALALTLCESDVVAAPQVIAVPDLAQGHSHIADAIERHPRAAMTLVGVLTINETASVPQGILAESAAYSMLLASAEFDAWRGDHPARPIPTTDQAAVLLRRRGAVLRATLNRPERRNSFSRQMRDGLIEAFDLAFADSSIESLEIDGAGPSFCSGGDLDEFGMIADVALAHLIRLDRSVGLRVAENRARTHFRLHGACIGAGIEIPAFAGMVTADIDTVFQLPELRMGLIPGAGGTVSITRRIGRWRTAYLAMSGNPLDAPTALEWGLIDEIR